MSERLEPLSSALIPKQAKVKHALETFQQIPIQKRC